MPKNVKQHAELMTRIAVFEATVNGKFDNVINHLAALNGQTSKNTGAIQQLVLDDKDIRTMVYEQGKREKEREENDNQRQYAREKKEDSWRKRWQDLLFGSLQWLLPAVIIGILLNGRAIAAFLGLVK